MAEIKTITYDCIVVDSSEMPKLRALGMLYQDKDFSQVTVHEALRFATNSDAAKAIRKLALDLGGQKITKQTVKFL